MPTRLVILATLLLAVSHFDRQIFAIVSPTLTRELGIGDAAYGVLAGAFSIAFLVGPPLAAVVLDRIGLKRGLILAVTSWSLVAALHSVASSFAGLFALRLALGIAESPSFPGAVRVVERAVQGPARARAIGFMLIGASIGAIVAAPFAGWLSARYGFRLAFVGTAAAGLLWIPAFLWIPRTEAGTHALDHPALATRRQERGAITGALRLGAVQHAILGVVAYSPVVAFALLWGAKLLVVRFNVAEQDVGKLLWIPPVFYDIGAIGFGELMSRVGFRPRMERALFVCASVLSLALALVGAFHASSAAVALSSIAMAGVAGCGAINTSVLVDRTPSTVTTVGAGILTAAQALVFALSSIAIGRIVQSVGGASGFNVATIAVSLWCAVFATAWLLWRPNGTAALNLPAK